MARTNRHPHRIAVYAHDSNPSKDKPILKKSVAYVSQLIANCEAYWVGDNRVKLVTGPRARVIDPWRIAHCPAEIPGLRFVMPVNYKGRKTVMGLELLTRQEIKYALFGA